MKEHELVSAILPLEHPSGRIGAAIESVQEQTYPAWELLIVSSLPEDEDTAALAAMYAENDDRIRWIQAEEGTNLAELLNIGLEEAQGNYIARVEACSVYAPERFEKQMEFLALRPMVYGCEAWKRCYGDMMWIQRSSPEATLMFRREPFKEYGLKYDPDSLLVDVDFLARAEGVFTLVCLPEVMCILKASSATKKEALATGQDEGELGKFRQLFALMDDFQREEAWNNWLRETSHVKAGFSVERSMKKILSSFKDLAKEADVYEMEYHLLRNGEIRKEGTIKDNVVDLMGHIGTVDGNLFRASQVFAKFLSLPEQSRVIIYGLGAAYHRLLEKWPAEELEAKFQVLGVMDAHNTTEDFPMIAREQLEEIDYDYILVTSGKYYREIKESLMEEAGVDEEKICMMDQIWLTMLQ